jgi:hypothetical protein
MQPLYENASLFRQTGNARCPGEHRSACLGLEEGGVPLGCGEAARFRPGPKLDEVRSRKLGCRAATASQEWFQGIRGLSSRRPPPQVAVNCCHRAPSRKALDQVDDLGGELPDCAIVGADGKVQIH